MTDSVEHATDPASWRGALAPDAAAAARAQDEPPDTGGAHLHRDARRLLAELARPYYKGIAAVLGIVLAQTAATMAGPWLIGIAIDDSLPDARDGGYASLIAVTAALAVCAGLSGWLRSVFVVRSAVIGQAMLYDLRRRGFDHVQALSVSFHERFTSGRVISRLTSDVEKLSELLEAGLDGLLTAMLNIAAITILLLVLDLPLAAVALSSLIPVWLLYRWFSARARVAFRRTRETVATMIVTIVETLNGVRAVQAFRREQRNDAIFAGLNGAYRDANRDAFNLNAVFIPGVTLIGNVTMVVVLLVGGNWVIDGSLALGVLTSFLLYLRQFYDPMEDVAMFYNSLQSATAALEKIALVLAETPGVPEPATPAELPQPVRGELRFEGVSFGYSDARLVLPALDLRIPAGQTVALVGATGAGKTTIAKLISRFYDPTGGAVLLDGVDLREIDESALRRAVVMITQDGFLFSGSVADNIGLGRLGATRADIVDAARAIGAHEFITALPDGYDTDVRKRGGRLSAGQRQLVSFARAFLADPAVLILDEATSSLDVPSERAVQRALRTVLANRTALIIAHRLSTVEIADRVLVLARAGAFDTPGAPGAAGEGGRIVEDGPPGELTAARSGEFAALHASWRDSLV